MTEDPADAQRTSGHADASEAARRIIASDPDSGTPAPPPLRFQWNVPSGVTPHIPLGVAALFFGLLALGLAISLGGRLTQPSPCDAAVDWREASLYEGRSATFGGPASAVEAPGDVLLEVGDAGPASLLVVIPERDLYKFGEDIHAAYAGRVVAVTGQVEPDAGGAARISVTRPENLVACS